MWEITREQSEGHTDNPSGNPEGRDSTKDKYNKGHTVIPYTQGLGESITNIGKRYGIQTHFKGNRTVKNILVKSKDKDPLKRKSGAIHWYQCGELTCDEKCIGETFRTFEERYKEHLKEPSPIYGHSNISGHSTNPDNFTIIGRKGQCLARTIKESTYIKITTPHSTGMWVSITFILYRTEFSTSELRINNDNGYAHRTPISVHFQYLPTNRYAHRTTEQPGHVQRTPTSEHAHGTS